MRKGIWKEKEKDIEFATDPHRLLSGRHWPDKNSQSLRDSIKYLLNYLYELDIIQFPENAQKDTG
jgi:hypothetical protein